MHRSPFSINGRSLLAMGVLGGLLSFPWATLPLVAQDAAKKPLAKNDDRASEASMAAYADAANFQTGGAIELAIAAWEKFLDRYPQHPMAAKAAHYMGVCYMQQEQPDYAMASQAFDRALKDKKYDLREESLANQGWCLYAAAGDGESADKSSNKGKLNQVMEVYSLLRKEYPQTRFLDRSFFYSGEAAYALGDSKRAIKFYDDLLSLPTVGDSPLRCDALYARGVAFEERDQLKKALASYQQLMDACADHSLATDVRMRLGDLYILRKDYDKAVSSFQNVIDASDKDKDSEAQENKAYALFRQAYALVQSGKPAQAAIKYEALAKKYPDSPYASSATLASGQSLYRSGDHTKAAKAFTAVLEQKNVAAATEAAHWLSRIAIGKGDHAQAAKIAKKRIDQGAEGDYAMDLKLDLAESLSMNPQKVAESLEIFEQAYRESPEDDLAPRALYNAAFSALQGGEPKKAQELSGEFLKQFPQDVLSLDVKFVTAEAHFAAGDAGQAAQAYERLIQEAKPSNPQRPTWVLRAATASNANREFDQTVLLIQRELKTLQAPAQKAEAHLLMGQAHMMADQGPKAAVAFAAAYQSAPQGPRASEAKLLQGQALVRSGKTGEATKLWNAIVQESPQSRMADQARYKIAEMATAEGKHDQAMKLYQQILESDQDPGLHPYAQYGIGFAQIQAHDYAAAAKSLDKMLDQYKKHPLASEARLSRGIANRNLKHYKAARKDLDIFLQRQSKGKPPHGANVGHALYELALIDGEQKKPEDAAAKLKRIVAEVPDYPSMEKVLYELGWAMQDSGQSEEAVKQFRALTSKYPDTALAGEAAYFVGQQHYQQKDWTKAAQQFSLAAQKSKEPEMQEKSLYRLGWSNFKGKEFRKAEEAFANQADKFPQSKLVFDARMMVAESRFKRGDYPAALEAYAESRKTIQAKNQTSQTIRDAGASQARELVLLHGGQSAAQVKQWDQALSWYEELRQRFPSSDYLPQVFYETGFAHQQKGDHEKALKFFGQVASKYRSALAARARFMMGEIHFADRTFHKAIPEFQRVMFGFGAEKAPESVKNWQAKSGFEAGRCSELLMQSAKTEAARQKASKIGRKFYTYVTEKHPNHELAEQARVRLKALQK